jgi:hypothetical protein
MNAPSDVDTLVDWQNTYSSAIKQSDWRAQILQLNLSEIYRDLSETVYSM